MDGWNDGMMGEVGEASYPTHHCPTSFFSDWRTHGGPAFGHTQPFYTHTLYMQHFCTHTYFCPFFSFSLPGTTYIFGLSLPSLTCTPSLLSHLPCLCLPHFGLEPRTHAHTRTRLTCSAGLPYIMWGTGEDISYWWMRRKNCVCPIVVYSDIFYSMVFVLEGWRD